MHPHSKDMYFRNVGAFFLFFHYEKKYFLENLKKIFAEKKKSFTFAPTKFKT